MNSKEGFNTLMLQEMGLEIDKRGNVVDQDTGTNLQFKGKAIKIGCTEKNEVEYNPIDNPNLMNALFNYYVDKVNREEDRYISVYYPSSKDKTEKGSIELRVGNETIKSDNFYNDSIKYGDLVLKLNGSAIKSDFTELDQEPIVKQR